MIITKESKKIFEKNRKIIPGGVVSLNRLTKPEIAFSYGKGSHVWDVDGNEYIDYHSAFGPYLLGHNDPDVNRAVMKTIKENLTLMGSGTNIWEGRLAELIVKHLPSINKVQLSNTGSEATFHAIRLSRAYTGRDGIIVMQGGYNGWHNDVACNLMTPIEIIGPRVSPGEYKFVPLSAGIPKGVEKNVHIVNFNDLESVEYVVNRYGIAAIILEPILQNVGIIQPKKGYLEGLRKICNKENIVLIFDEVKTGFRHALGGYQKIAGVLPDLTTLGKALANGYPIAAVGGRADIMDYFIHKDPIKKVLIAGTYNAHPIPTNAAIATLEKLEKCDKKIYGHIYMLGEMMQTGLEEIFEEFGIIAKVARVGSAFCVYFMDHLPVDWHDLVMNHDSSFDSKYRTALIQNGIYHFPTPTKQGSISFAHSKKDIEITLESTRKILKTI
ncbi:MAG: aspartate aminotransferase family protein [Ignavibacteriaceae bacterium]